MDQVVSKCHQNLTERTIEIVLFSDLTSCISIPFDININWSREGLVGQEVVCMSVETAKK